MANKGNEHWVLPGEADTERLEKDRLYVWLTLAAAVGILGVCCGAGVALGVLLS